MRRDMDLIRTIMITVERDGSPSLKSRPTIAGYDDLIVGYHLTLLMQAGYIDAITLGSKDNPIDFAEITPTWLGSEFIETIRDPEIWSKTKEDASKVGSWSINVLSTVAKAAVVAKMHALGIG